jgi:translation initiation factor IF-2
MGEKKIGDKMEKRETKAKPKKIDIIEDAIDMDVVDRKKAKKPKIEVIAEEVETPAVVSKDNKKAKGFEKTKQKPNFVKEKEEVVVEKPVEKKEEPEIKIIRMGSEISLKELAEKLHHNPTEIIKKLFMKGQMFTINSVLSFEMAEEIAIEYEFLVEKEEEKVK